jgi:hypothetical protein
VRDAVAGEGRHQFVAGRTEIDFDTLGGDEIHRGLVLAVLTQYRAQCKRHRLTKLWQPLQENVGGIRGGGCIRHVNIYSLSGLNRQLLMELCKRRP